MIVGDFHIAGVSVAPVKADSPLLIDPNAVLSGSIPCQLFQPITRGPPEVVQMLRGVKNGEFPLRKTLKIQVERSDTFATEHSLCLLVAERSNHV